jgi:hypothetical protein
VAIQTATVEQDRFRKDLVIAEAPTHRSIQMSFPLIPSEMTMMNQSIPIGATQRW